MITEINDNMKTAELLHIDTKKKRLSHLTHLKKDTSTAEGIMHLKNEAVHLVRRQTLQKERKNRSPKPE